MTAELWVAVIVALFGGGTILGLLRLRGENSRIVVDAAQGAVVVQSSVIRDLREQMEQLTARVQHVEDQARQAEERAEVAENRANRLAVERDALLRANDDMRGENEQYAQLNADLERRVAHLEAEVQRLGGTLP